MGVWMHLSDRWVGNLRLSSVDFCLYESEQIRVADSLERFSTSRSSTRFRVRT